MRTVFAATFAAWIATCTVAPRAMAEYYCSPGFEPAYGGRCIASITRDEIDLYLNDSSGEPSAPLRHVRHRHRRHGLVERY